MPSAIAAATAPASDAMRHAMLSAAIATSASARLLCAELPPPADTGALIMRFARRWPRLRDYTDAPHEYASRFAMQAAAAVISPPPRRHAATPLQRR
jgi:hypothetical protein